MLSNYLKIAFRNLSKQKVYTVINVTGLAIGLACCLLIFLFVRHETSFDTFHEHSDRIYRVIQHETELTRAEENFAVTPFSLADRLADNHVEIEEFTRVFTMERLMRRDDGETFQERAHFADPSILTMFSFPLLQGDITNALNDPYNVILTREMAEKYFGSENPVGQVLAMQYGAEFRNFTVSGVAENIPVNSSIRFDFLIPFAQLYNMINESTMQNWGVIAVETYLMLPEDADTSNLEAAFTETVTEPYAQVFGPGLVSMILQPITDIHLNTTYTGGIEPVSNPRYSIILGSIAVMVLMIACINFMILAVGRSAKRSKEVGMRKVMGATGRQLRIQFWGEAILLSILAMIMGVVIAELFLPTFNTLSGSTLSFSYDVLTISLLLGLIFIVGLTAGSYPAMVLSSFNPIHVLKGELKVGGRNTLRKTLVITQFAISIFLISATLIMLNQLNYLQNKSLGFDKEHVIALVLAGPAAQREQTVELLRNELSNQPSVTSLAGSSTIFGNPWSRLGYTADDGTYREVFGATVDYGFLQTMGLELLEGRDFSREISSDVTEGIIINETLAREYGWSDPIGQRLPGSNFPQHQVVGVVRDFHFRSLHTSVNPVVLMLSFDSLQGGIQNIDDAGVGGINWASIRITPGDDITGTLAMLENTWKTVAPNLPFEYTFLDDNISMQYIQEERMGMIAGYSSALAIFIACLGLFGLATLTSEQRVKEIGVRKVLGANITSITLMLSKDFARLVVIALALAIPFTWYIMNQWLEDFAYRIIISPWIFLLAGALAMFIALATVSWQSVKAALANPVDSLRSE